MAQAEAGMPTLEDLREKAEREERERREREEAELQRRAAAEARRQREEEEFLRDLQRREQVPSRRALSLALDGTAVADVHRSIARCSIASRSPCCEERA